MKKRIYDIIVSTLVFWIVVDLVRGIDVSGGYFVLVLLGIIWGIVALVVKRTIRFLTLPLNIWTIIGITSVFGVALFTIYNFIAVGIDFTVTNYGGYEGDLVIVNSFKLDMVGNILMGGIITGVINGILIVLDTKKK